MFVRKPILSPVTGKWVVTIAQSRSPSSEVIERMEFDSREAAWQAYRRARDENF